MARFGMVIEVDKCVGCFACYLACRDEHAGTDHRPVAAAQPASGRGWIRLREEERGSFPKVKVSYVPVPCLHCAEASCVAASRDGAVYRREDGIVLIDPVDAAGERDLVSACPYGAITWNEEKNLPQKCTLCAHLLDAGWREPRCVEACPTRAMVFGDLDEPHSDIARLRAAGVVENLRPEFGMRPRVAYKGLPKRFITGEIAFADNAEEPAADVAVTLRRGAELRAASTDSYGDFEFDGVDADSEYVLRVEHAGYAPRELPVRTGTDVDLGTIALAPAP